jgi:chitin synthase
MLSKQLVDIAKNGKKKSKILSGATKMEHVLESFGSFKTNSSKNSSGFGRYTEYQYSSSGRMVGVKLLDYGFNRSRVTNGQSLPDGERPFNVFYQLLAGATDEEKEKLFLTEPANFLYTKGSLNLPSGTGNTLTRTLSLGRTKSLRLSNKPVRTDAQATVDDVKNFTKLKDNLKSLGIGKRTQFQIFKVLAAILHIGNLSFSDDDIKPQEPCVIRNLGTLNIIAQLLSVSVESLKDCILYKSTFVGQDKFSTVLKSQAATEQCSALAQVLYSLLFTWIIEHFNERLCKSEQEVDNCIGVLDFPWFQELQPGSVAAKFNTFYYNYAQERLIHYINLQNFDRLEETFVQQKIDIKYIPEYIDNQSVIDLFDGSNKIPGLFSVLEKASKLSIPKDSNLNQVLAKNMDSTFKLNKNYVQSHRANTDGTCETFVFGVKHYLGQWLQTALEIWPWWLAIRMLLLW